MLLFYLQISSYSLYLKCCKLAGCQPVFDHRGRGWRCCATLLIKSLFKKRPVKEALRLIFYSLEAVTESLNWSMPLGSDALMEEEVQNRVKGVLWEADSLFRMYYQTAVRRNWRPAKHRHTFCETWDLPQMPHLASWAVSFRPFMSPSEYWVAGQGQQQQTPGVQPVNELWHNSRSTALLNWLCVQCGLQAGLLSDR